MGPRQEAQPALFYEFSLKDHVPQKHFLRTIDRFVDLSGTRSYLTDFYSHTGRPSVDPELLIRMLLVGYSLGIRSERRLCEEVHLNLAYRWYALRPFQADPWPEPAPIARTMRRKRRISPRRHRTEPQQAGQDPPCTAATARSLTGKALAPRSAVDILRQRTGVFPRNRRRAVVRCAPVKRLLLTAKQPLEVVVISHPKDSVAQIV